MGYQRPTELDKALALLASGNLTILAGGTDLYPATTAPELPGEILDITALDDLRGIEESEDHWRIGGLTSWSGIVSAHLPPAFDALKMAAREIGAIQIQNSATIAGNLCNASPAADGVPVLLILDAEVELVSVRGVRRVPLGAFITGPRRTCRRSDEILSAVLIPKTASEGRSGFLKLGARKYLVISIAMAAARVVVRDGVIAEAALAIGACGPVATRLGQLETKMAGRPVGEAVALLDDAAIGDMLDPINDIRSSAGYRRRAAAELMRRTVAPLLMEAGR